ncbi:hypothetical protein [Candidatus Enterovibrio escicola]|uniref:Mobile element protein n=1 Tax=Candidatus Enterovibrio escicola TaxID=1927127 RepID=A0A2A5T5A7_9GAMM|nr:hypothetical protein [Candidatus Enterovibrio escacola]PCS23321.1 hypothetical protein BTN49_1318 [Candidatus Enterovibrio escacola]
MSPRTEEQKNNATIPPRSSSESGEEWHPRNKAIKALKEDKLAEWKRT